jgi:HlyD family secretion protein
VLRLLTNRRVLVSAAVVGILLAVALWPSVVPVDIGAVSRGPLVVTIDEEGRTRVRDRFVVSAPVAGRIVRIELEPGDQVRRGAVVAQIRPEVSPLLDPRARAEAQAALDSARATLGRVRAEEQRARAAASLALRELERVRELVKNELSTQQALEARESEARVAQEAATAAAYAVAAAAAEIERAEARLAPSTRDGGRVIAVTAPAEGVVLRRLRESESVVPAGEALLEIGDPDRLEIVSDLLSTDAVRVNPGARALIEQWGGSHVLNARVRRVEPSGFTKISALGVEEQRVNVILDFVEPSDALIELGDAYRVEVRVVVWEAPDVLKVPTSALFREGDAWAVYVADAGRARRTTVEIGHQTGQEAEVLSGLAEGTRVIVHPGDTLTEGSRIEPRAFR